MKVFTVLHFSIKNLKLEIKKFTIWIPIVRIVSNTKMKDIIILNPYEFDPPN